MKALRIHDYGAPLQIEDAAIPVPGAGQVLVENYFTSRNGVDPGRGQGYLRHVFALEFPWIPGGDFAGRVAAVGDAVTDFKAGDEVFGYTRAGGAYAEYVAAEFNNMAHRPAAISRETAAAISLVGQTAMQMLQLSRIRAGQTLAILGASGGVGSLAVQLARNAGVHVIATARRSNADALRRLGAERVVDLGQEQLEAVGKVDAVLNLIGAHTVARSYALVNSGGVAVTSNRPPDVDEANRLGIGAALWRRTSGPKA